MASATNCSGIASQPFMPPPPGGNDNQGFNDELYASAAGVGHHGGRGMTAALMVGGVFLLVFCVLIYSEVSTSVAKSSVISINNDKIS